MVWASEARDTPTTPHFFFSEKTPKTAPKAPLAPLLRRARRDNSESPQEIPWNALWAELWLHTCLKFCLIVSEGAVGAMAKSASRRFWITEREFPERSAGRVMKTCLGLESHVSEGAVGAIASGSPRRFRTTEQELLKHHMSQDTAQNVLPAPPARKQYINQKTYVTVILFYIPVRKGKGSILPAHACHSSDFEAKAYCKSSKEWSRSPT